MRILLNLCSAFLFLIVILTGCNSENRPDYTQWEIYGGSKNSIRYSSLTQVDTSNVSQLKVAWEYHTGDEDTTNHSQIQCNPIIVNGILYGTTPRLRLFALNAATGEEKWIFDPDSSSINSKSFQFILNNNRGVTYWEDHDDKRILYTAGSYIYCINALTGKLITGFGDSGKVDLHDDLGRDVKNLFVTSTSPGIIYHDLYIIGTRVSEEADAAPGHIRAYDVRTGKLKWIFHTIPWPGEKGYSSWDDPNAWKHIGGANCWSGFSLDEKRGILFAPTGSASFDFYGGMRRGNDLFANCLLALDASTGKLIWYFQFVHHDLWDKDLPTAPSLVTVTAGGKKFDAVAQPTKYGYIYLFDRTSGKPLYPIKEIRVPDSSDLKGEKLSPTQPVPENSEPFVRQTFTVNDINPYLPDSSRNEIIERLKNFRYGNMFLPPGKKTSIVFPGFDGGAEWGGPAVDPSTGWMYINANEMGWELNMVPTKPESNAPEKYLDAGARLYGTTCMGCHGKDRKGSGNYPSIVNVKSKYTFTQLNTLLQTGRRMMPSFKQLSDQDRRAIISFITDNHILGSKKYIPGKEPVDTFLNLPYQMTGYNKFLSKEGYPAIGPPWGTLNAFNLNTGKIEWKVPLGEYPELVAKGIPQTGTENYGGPVVTAGGLVFIAATKDNTIRAFNKRNGKLVWEANLPASGFATPAVYMLNGKEYIVIACGGGKLNTKSGDAYVAFSL
jgi:quinoprotein glucose dehydrogenase